VNRGKEKTTSDRGKAERRAHEETAPIALIASELPELVEKDQRLHDAMQERTTSGALRRAIHSSKVLLPDLADRAQTDMDTLDAFLTGERPLTSDIIDRLTKILKLKLEGISSKQKPRPSKAG
jgi:hypothetical protein